MLLSVFLADMLSKNEKTEDLALAVEVLSDLDSVSVCKHKYYLHRFVFIHINLLK